MQKLGVNTIRVYYVDTTANHDGCMSAFANAGIYVLVALDSAYSAINRVCRDSFEKGHTLIRITGQSRMDKLAI